MERFDVQILVDCLMGNRYHFVLHTRSANLSRLMRHVNGVYTRTTGGMAPDPGAAFDEKFE